MRAGDRTGRGVTYKKIEFYSNQLLFGTWGKQVVSRAYSGFSSDVQVIAAGHHRVGG